VQAAEFRAFLKDYGAALDVATTRRLLAEFGRTCAKQRYVACSLFFSRARC
jgi:hypothetical protein